MVPPSTIVPPIAVGNKAIASICDVAFEVVVEALAFGVPPSTIVPPTIDGNEATTSTIGDVASMGADDVGATPLPDADEGLQGSDSGFGPTSTTLQHPAPQTPIQSWNKHITS